MHEAQMHEFNSFVTLTYDAAHLPADLSLRREDFTLFMKRLRERLRVSRKDCGEPKATGNIRFYMCGEYGEENSRPHYHVIVFGFYPVDAVFYRKTQRGDNIFTSAFLESVWGKGRVFVGNVTLESAGYVARYCLKKIDSDGEFREILDVSTGEIILRVHEFGGMSLKPGIGATWFKKFARDVFPHDRCIVRGSKNGVPKYYDKLLDVYSPLYAAEIKAARAARHASRVQDVYNVSPEDLTYTDLRRLDVHEVVKLAQLKLLKRS